MNILELFGKFPINILRNVRDIFVFLVAGYIAIASITEVTARNGFLNNLDYQIDTINEQLAQNVGTDKTLTEDTIDIRRNTVREFQYFKVRLESLISVGADKDHHKLEAIREEFEGILSDPSVRDRGDKVGRPSNWSFILIFQYYVKGLSSDVLLGITIIICAAIGAGIGALRSENALTIRSLIFGLSTGFIMFLIIKGGVHIFIFKGSGDILQFNPYSSALSGLIAGMFTEKVFGAITLVTDSVLSRVEKIIDE